MTYNSISSLNGEPTCLSKAATPPVSHFTAKASSLSSLDASTAATHDLLNLFGRRHGRVTRGGHRERAVGRAVIDRLLRIACFEEAVDQAACKTVAAAHAVKDFQFGILAALVKLAAHPADRAPIVLRGGEDLAQGGGGDLGVLELGDCLLDHLLEGVGLDLREVVVHAFDFETEAGREVLLVADHHIDVFGDLAVHFARLFLAADALPQARPIIQVVADDRAVLGGGLDRLDGECRGRFAQRREDAARMEPAHAQFAKNLLPVEIAGLELAGGGVAAIRHADSATDTEPAFGEI